MVKLGQQATSPCSRWVYTQQVQHSSPTAWWSNNTTAEQRDLVVVSPMQNCIGLSDSFGEVSNVLCLL